MQDIFAPSLRPVEFEIVENAKMGKATARPAKSGKSTSRSVTPQKQRSSSAKKSGVTKRIQKPKNATPVKAAGNARTLPTVSPRKEFELPVITGRYSLHRVVPKDTTKGTITHVQKKTRTASSGAAKHDATKKSTTAHRGASAHHHADTAATTHAAKQSAQKTKRTTTAKISQKIASKNQTKVAHKKPAASRKPSKRTPVKRV